MSFGRTVRSVFQALTNMYFARSFEKISLTGQLYLGVPKVEITLVSHVGGEVESMKLSVDEARQILRSMRYACERNDVEEIKVGELTWKTDARLHSNGSDEIIIKFSGPQGSTHTPARREDVRAAIAEFADRFSPD